MIDLQLENHVYAMNLANPPYNVIDPEFVNQLEEALDSIDVEKASALIIHSSLPVFSSGANLHQLYQKLGEVPEAEQESQLRRFIDHIHRVFNRLDLLPIMTVAVVNGLCFGGGFELALCCDVIIAEKNARFCFPELRLGIIPGFGGIMRLKREVSHATIRDLLLTGRSLNATRLHQLGLVSQVAGTGEGLAIARCMAERSNQFDAGALKTTKEFLKQGSLEQLEQEKELFITMALDKGRMALLEQFITNKSLFPYLPKR